MAINESVALSDLKTLFHITVFAEFLAACAQFAPKCPSSSSASTCAHASAEEWLTFFRSLGQDAARALKSAKSS